MKWYYLGFCDYYLDDYFNDEGYDCFFFFLLYILKSY